MSLERCPACNLPYVMVGRSHRCVAKQNQAVLHTVKPTASSESAGNPAGTQAIGAYQSTMSVTPPAAGDGLNITANRGVPATISNVVSIRKPKRDRAFYMRSYRARKKARGIA